MRCAPIPNEDQFGDPYDDLVADPLADSALQLWNDIARKNREVFTDVFKSVPTNLVRDWKAYNVSSTS
jgi:phospholipase D1/2